MNIREQGRAGQGRAEQSRAEQSRAEQSGTRLHHVTQAHLLPLPECGRLGEDVPASVGEGRDERVQREHLHSPLHPFLLPYDLDVHFIQNIDEERTL